MLRATFATLAAGGLLALGVVVAPAASAAGPVAGDWGATAGAFRGQNGSRFDYVCPAGGALGSLWGSGVYTDDSSVCTAATHAGVLAQQTGGTVTIEIRAGEAAYTGTTGNGVTSRSYGSFSGSFAVVTGHGGGGVAGASMGGLGWAATVKAYRGQNRSRYAVICPAGGTVGRVWGTDTYTDDSSVCSAGVHVGAITAAGGGTVVAEIRPGLSGYVGSAHNGVTSSGYGAWGGSFVVAGAKPVGTTSTATPANTPVSGTVAASWSSDTRAFRGKVGSLYRFSCPAGGRPSVVWGSGTYTDDSSVCTAAVHAGLISFARGGTVTVQVRAGLRSYVGSTRNGVPTHRYGAWPGAYVFVGGSTATTTSPAAPTGGTGWSADTRAYRGKVGSLYRFSCPAGGRASVVWGTGTYTDDSSVCTAAVHAGLISFAGGGMVTVQIRPGLSSYAGTTRNGVTTKGYGAWSGAYVFVR